jgi:hypothetical protein
MKHRFPAALIVGLAMLTGVVSAASNAAVRTAGLSLLCSILLRAHELAHLVYRILIAR